MKMAQQAGTTRSAIMIELLEAVAKQRKLIPKK